MKPTRIFHLAFVTLLALGLALSQASEMAGAYFGGDGNRVLEDASLAGPSRFWYERTFGETEVAFFADTEHIYNPEGIGLDASGNLWVAETLGARVLKYSGNGAFLDSIGEAGRVWLADNQHISQPQDVAVDGDGNVWVVDQNSHRVVSSSIRLATFCRYWGLPGKRGLTTIISIIQGEWPSIAKTMSTSAMWATTGSRYLIKPVPTKQR
jgi:hypothetical protein